MSKLYITEYGTISTLPAVSSGQIPLEPPIMEQVIDFTGGQVRSNPFQMGTRMIRLNCDATCSVLIGPNPTATTSSGRFATNQTEFRGIPEGMGYMVSVIGNI